MTRNNTPPRGKVKGGARFPRFSLAAAVPWARKLVSKTHLGPQPRDVVMAGVVESKGPRGEIKISSLKQFELIEGDSKGYVATDLAKRLANSPPEEITPLLQTAALKPTLFRSVFDTFHGDKVSFSKIRQRFTDLNVHPDSADECVTRYIETLEFANLGSRDADDFNHVSAITTGGEDQPNGGNGEPDDTLADDPEQEHEEGAEDTPAIRRRPGNPRAAIQITVNLDSSLDTEKLENQLKLLQKYGAI